MIDITHIKWSNSSIGVAMSKLVPGLNIIKITAKSTSGELYYPNVLVVDKQALMSKYGVTQINKRGLLGIWIPTKDFEQYYVKEDGNGPKIT